jgi:hypothetical protein
MSSSYKFNEGALVVTSISPPNPVLKALAQGCLNHGSYFIVVGDTKSPEYFELEGCDYFSVSRQRNLDFKYASICRESSYTRKNIGYLIAIQSGAKFIVETDDDNYPTDQFWQDRHETVSGDTVFTEGWVNAYAYFADNFIYPRGFPLELARGPHVAFPLRAPALTRNSLIQQGLADGNPDVDAIYRMLFPLPFDFKKSAPLILPKHTWCPFNSQNTTFFSDAYPLLYLPTFCSFRMTDIWRSFVAQRLLWTVESELSFHEATVFQDRNEHSLLRDFEDEIPGYLNNLKIVDALNNIDLCSGLDSMGKNMMICYEKLCSLNMIGSGELNLLESWLADLSAIRRMY